MARSISLELSTGLHLTLMVALSHLWTHNFTHLSSDWQQVSPECNASVVEKMNSGDMQVFFFFLNYCFKGWECEQRKEKHLRRKTKLSHPELAGVGRILYNLAAWSGFNNTVDVNGWKFSVFGPKRWKYRQAISHNLAGLFFFPFSYFFACDFNGTTAVARNGNVYGD